MSYIMVDIEADAPIPEDYSMVSIGACGGERRIGSIVIGRLQPISEKFIPEALKVSGHSPEETLKFEDPRIELKRFEKWVATYSISRPIFIRDNNGFDWMFIC